MSQVNGTPQSAPEGQPVGTTETAAKAGASKKASAKRSATVVRRPVTPPWTRLAHWVIALVSGVLLAVAGAGYWHHRGQVADISAEHLRLMVFGPGRLRPDVAQQYVILTSAVTGDPVSAQIEFALSTPDGKQILMGHQEKTDEQGYLLVPVPADLQVPSGAELKIVATSGSQIERIETRLDVTPLGYLAHLSLDKPVYHPGQTVRYRSLTLSRFSLTSDHAVPIRFEFRDPQGKLVVGSALEGIAKEGVAGGGFQLPAQAAEGGYTLIATSPEEAFPERRLGFDVRRAETPVKVPLADTDKLEVTFYPEGGQLVAGLENRVYFVARDSSGRPVPITGQVVDEQGEELASVETSHAGMGTFSLEPRTGESYRLKIESPAGVRVEPVLPEAITHRRVVLTAGVGVFPAGSPLEFNVRVTEDDLPLVAAAYCRGVLVGQEAFLSGSGANEVTVDLDEKASGVIRLVVFDYSDNPPRPVAQRLVYRHPASRLQVQVEEPLKRAGADGKMQLSVSVTDEEGRPVEAVLGAAVVDQAAFQAADKVLPSLPADILLASELEPSAGLAGVEIPLADDSKSALALDLWLGTRGWHRLAEAAPREARRATHAKSHLPSRAEAAEELDPPAVYDNLLDLQKRLQKSFGAYQDDQTELRSVLTTLTIFGGAGLLLLATMLTLMNVATGLRIWIPAAVASLVCLLVGGVLVSPGALHAGPGGPVPFVPFQILPAAPKAESIGSRSAKPQGEAIEGARHRFAAGADSGDERLETLYWNPLLRTSAQGQARLEFDLPSSTSELHIQIDATGVGRLGAAERRLRVSSP